MAAPIHIGASCLGASAPALTLDALAENPAQARVLTPDQRLLLIQRAAALLAGLQTADAQATLADSRPKTSTEDELLTAEQIAERFKVAKTWPHEQARLGKLPCVMLGRWRRFRLADIEAAIAKNGETD